MKQIYITLALSLIVIFSFANPVITVVNNHGKWKNNSTWNLGRKPQDGDTILVPVGMTVLVDNNINLGNGTVYLKVSGTVELDGGKLNFGQSSVVRVMNGASIVAHGSSSEQIKIGNTIKYKGSEGMIAGPAIANSSTGTSPNGFAAQGPGALPVTFIGFNVARQNKNVIIDWSTAQEINSKYFEVQRSVDGSNWITIATITAAGTASNGQTYTYMDHSVVDAAILYYRIRQVDIDGRFELTAVRSVKTQDNDIRVKISSSNNHSLYLHFSSQLKGNVSVKLVSLNGQLVYQSSLSNPIGQQLLSVTNNLKGMYVVAVSDSYGFQQTAQIIL